MSRLMVVYAALLFCLPAATAPTQANALALGQQQNASTRVSALSQVAHMEASVHAVGVSGTLAYAVVDSSLHVIDVSNLAQPARLTSIDLHDKNIYNLQIAGDRVYLTSVEGVLRIVDIRNPQQPALLSTQNLDLVRLRMVGNLAYAIVQGGSLRVFDVSNPLDVQLRGSYAPASGFYAIDLQVAGGIAYVASYDSGFQIIDLRDPSHPRRIGQLNDPYYMSIAISGNRAYLSRATNSDPHYLDVVDIGQPSRPRRLGSLQTSLLSDLQVVGALLYAVADNALRIFDISQSAAPRLVGSYTMHVYPAYSQTTRIALVGSRVFVAADQDGLLILDTTNPALPRLLGQYGTIGSTNAVQIVGNLAYLASGSYLRILDISDPAHPIQRGSSFFFYEIAPGVTHSIGLLDLRVRGNLAYVIYTFVPTLCCQYGVMEIIDISDPAHPIRRGSFTTNGISDIQVVDQRVYYTGAFRLIAVPTLAILDASNPGNPTLLGSYGGNDFDPVGGDYNGAAAVDVAGSTAYVADYNDGLKIIDVSNPVSPTLRSRLNTPGSANDVQIAGGLTYIADGDGGLQIVDISNPSSPAVRGSMPTIGGAVGVRVVGDLAYIAAGDSGVQLVDISDPARPLPRARYDTPGYARHIDVAGDTLYVADQAEGLQILKLAPLPSISASIVPGGDTLVSPADATSYTFAAGTFSGTATVTHTIHFSDAMPSTGSLAGGHAFDIQARDSASGQLLQPAKPYSITIQYSDADRGPAIESTLALYFWDGSAWVKEPSSTLDLAAHTISATPSHFSLWAVLGETRRAFLPLSQR